MKDELHSLKRELETHNHRLAHLTTFRHSVARLLHLRDLPDTTIIHRLHSLINAHEEYASITKRYDDPATPPLPTEETLPPVHAGGGGGGHRPLSSSPVHGYSDHYLDHHHGRHHDHYDDDFKF